MSAVGGDAARKLVLSACTVGGEARRPPAAGGDSRSAGAGGTGESEKLEAERLAKWQWSDEFLAKARPDKGNYGQGDLFDDGLTKLERAQIEQGREAYLTGGAKLRYKRLTGQI